MRRKKAGTGHYAATSADGIRGDGRPRTRLNYAPTA
jgi:hypothetical protein